MDIDKLDKEVEELEKKMFGTPEADTTISPQPSSEDTRTSEAQPQADLVNPTVEPEEKKDAPNESADTNWEKRYKGIRNSRDKRHQTNLKTIADKDQELLRLQQELNQLRSQVPAETIDPLEGLISEEDKEAVGDTAMDAMKRTAEAIADSKVKDLQDKLDRLETQEQERVKKAAAQSAVTSHNSFLDNLEKLVPGYQEIDSDKSFHQFMNENDIDGAQRLTHYKLAEQRQDYGAIAKYMLEWKAQNTVDPLEAEVTPVPSAASPTPVKEPKAPDARAELLTLMQDHEKKLLSGYYRNRLAEEIATDKKIEAMMGAI